MQLVLKKMVFIEYKAVLGYLCKHVNDMFLIIAYRYHDLEIKYQNILEKTFLV